MIAAVLTAVLSIAGAQAAARTQTYDQAVRCAGLAQAASELEGGESREGRALYDAALYWSLMAVQAGEAARRAPAAAEADQTRARIRAVRELSADDGQARADLRRCRERTPSLG